MNQSKMDNLIALFYLKIIAINEEIFLFFPLRITI